MRSAFPLILILFFATQKASAQEADPLRVTAQFDNTGLGDFVLEIEKQTGVHFFYDSAKIDTVYISQSFDQAPLYQVLDLALAHTTVRFAIYGKYVFLTPGTPIVTTFHQPILKPATAAPIAIAGSEKPATTQIQTVSIGEPGSPVVRGRAVISGTIRDGQTGEPLPGASVQIEKLKLGIVSDIYGYYSLALPPGTHMLTIQSVGMNDLRTRLIVHGDGTLNVELENKISMLRNVIISAQKVSNVRGAQMGVQKIDIKAIRQVPVVFGEVDVLKVVTTLPGVKTVGEASTGLNVRGGSADQNLILFNESTIFNPAHFFGMFSAFNPDIVKDVTLYKSSVPARYGGRLSSVLDITGKEGNKKKLSGSAGIGLLTSRLTLEGPLIKDKTSFILGGRTTYANWMLNLLPDEYKNSKAGFYDLNAVLTHEFDKKNSLYVSTYFSSDHFNLNSDTAYNYSNQNAAVKWKHIFTNKLNAQFTAGIDKYNYGVMSEQNPINAYDLSFGITQYHFRSHFNYYLNPNNTLDFGLHTVNYRMSPGAYMPRGESSLVVADILQNEQALESALYINDKMDLLPSLSVETGIRYSVYNFQGPKDINVYAPGLPVTEENFTGQVSYGKGKFINTYGGPEFRISARQMLGLNSSIKAGFSTHRQYIHMLSNTAAIAPTDIWKLSDPNIRPQTGRQISLGYYQNLKSNTIEASVEIYYKNITDYLDFRSGATLVMNRAIETDVIGTRGRAYGAELLVKKTAGKLNGWVGYTYSRIMLRQSDSSAGEIINNGNYYPANYDKPHDFTAIGNYKINHRFSISVNATYSTGRPITLPIGKYYFAGSYRTLYDQRNAHRIPDYFRTDVSLNLDGNHKLKQKTHNSWTLGVYNLTGRRNPFSVYYVSENGVINGYKLSIFGSAIPFISFNIRF